jgi:hypothetical protein
VFLPHPCFSPRLPFLAKHTHEYFGVCCSRSEGGSDLTKRTRSPSRKKPYLPSFREGKALCKGWLYFLLVLFIFYFCTSSLLTTVVCSGTLPPLHVFLSEIFDWTGSQLNSFFGIVRLQVFTSDKGQLLSFSTFVISFSYFVNSWILFIWFSPPINTRILPLYSSFAG